MFALDAFVRRGRIPIAACRTYLLPSILLTVLSATVTGLASGQAPGTQKSTERTEFIRYGNSVDTRTAWPKPLHYKSRDLVWVITADPFAFDLAHGYFLLNDAAMYLLPPLLKRTHADLVKAKASDPAQASELAKIVKQLEVVISKYDSESWDIDEPDYGVTSERTACIDAIRALLREEGWSDAPFKPEHLSKATARLWVRYAELIRCLWGDERFGFPGWALKLSWQRLGLPQRGNWATFERGGVLPRIGDFLDYAVTDGSTWARRPAWSEDGAFRSAASTRSVLTDLVEAGAREPAGEGSYRGAIWHLLKSMLNGASPVALPENRPLRLATTPTSAGVAWSAVRTESVLASAAMVRRGTLDSLLYGGVRGGRRGRAKPPRLFVLYAINASTWQALERALAQLKKAQEVVLNLKAELEGDSRSTGVCGVPVLEGFLLWEKALRALSEAQGEHDTVLIQELSVDEKIAGVVNAISFSNNRGVRTTATRPLADPAQTRDRIPPESWLRAAYLPQPMRRIHFRFLLDGEPVEGIGVVPMLKVKNPAGDLKELHELWSR